MKNKARNIVTGSVVLASLLMAGTAFAATPGRTHENAPTPRPAVVGTVVSISGTTLTVSSKNWQRSGSTTPAATTTYTVDATNAAVTKAGTTSSVSSIAVGDQLMIKGTATGTAVTATKINVVTKTNRSEKTEKMSASKTKLRAPHTQRTPKVTASSTPERN